MQGTKRVNILQIQLIRFTFCQNRVNVGGNLTRISLLRMVITMVNQVDCLISGGLLVTGQGVERADIVIKDGIIIEISREIKEIQASRTIDAHNKYVLPGAIDAHCHPVYADKMDTMSLCAAYGGITTLIPFIGNNKAWGYSGRTDDVVKRFIEDSLRDSLLDFAVHGIFTVADCDTVERSVPALIKMGVTSFKMYMAYSRRGMQIPDETIVTVMDLAAKDGGITMVHAETGCCIDYLIDMFIAEGKVQPQYFLPSQPSLLEMEAVTRVATFSAVTGCPLYPVHLSAKETPPVLNYFKELDKAPLFGETCPHYLTLTNDLVLDQGNLAKCGPPLRESEDNKAMWEAVANGLISTVASDSCNLSAAMKKTGGMTSQVPSADKEYEETFNIFEGSFGLNTIEFMVPVVWSRGVNTGLITLPRLVHVLCENPAKIFGLYPQKGALAVGSDADVVIWDPSKQHTVTRPHGNGDFTSFEGFELLGMPVLVMQRGNSIIEDGEVIGKPGRARFLRSDPNVSAYAQKGYKVI